MRQHVELYHTLEMRRKVNADEWQSWHKPTAGMFRACEVMAYHGRLIEAIEEAERTQIENYGDMHGIEFRCVTKQRTVTATAKLHEGWDA